MRGVWRSFSKLRQRRNEARAFLFAFDLLELDGLDMRREPIETRKATLASILRKSLPGLRLNEHTADPKGALVFQHLVASSRVPSPPTYRSCSRPSSGARHKSRESCSTSRVEPVGHASH